MAAPNIPIDLKAEALLEHIASKDSKVEVELCGSHKRNAYCDVLEIVKDVAAGTWNISLCRDGLYDILPEGLFHPIDRFESLPVNEYHERFAEECEKQQLEEANARRFFKPYDTFMLGLGCKAWALGQQYYSSSNVLAGIICDTMPEGYKKNRFVARAMPFVPSCSKIRGEKTLLSMMLRKVFCEEGLRLDGGYECQFIADEAPRYNCSLDSDTDGEPYLGNEFLECVTIYIVHYWSDDECDAQFMDFVSEMEVFEAFVNEYFVGIEEKVKFDISTDTLPVRLSDELYYNYLNYNTNI